MKRRLVRLLVLSRLKLAVLVVRSFYRVYCLYLLLLLNVAELNSAQLTQQYHRHQSSTPKNLKNFSSLFNKPGPRKSGEGCEDEAQAILLATITPTQGARLLVTILASGFVIGPEGASIQEICRTTGKGFFGTFVGLNFVLLVRISILFKL